MNWTQIVIAIIGALGVGGIGAALVNWLANKKSKQVNDFSSLAKVYEERLKALADRAASVECRVEKLEKIIKTLNTELDSKDDIIEILQRAEKAHKDEIDKLNKERLEQIETNRKQGERIHKLRLENTKLKERITLLEEKLGNAKS